MSRFGSDDLASVIVRRDREFAGYAEGVIRAWNSDTFEHTINVRGSDLHNLDVCSGVEALTYQPGDMVILTKWKPRSGKGSATYRIGSGGRIIRPGTDAAEKAVEFLRGELARQISGEVFADRIISDEVTTYVEIANESWIDLPGSPGPSVTVEVSQARRMLVMIGAYISATDNQGYMSVEISGATSLAPSFRRLVAVLAASGFGADAIGAGRMFEVPGPLDPPLNPGIHTVTMKYQTQSDVSPGALFGDRDLYVIPF